MEEGENKRREREYMKEGERGREGKDNSDTYSTITNNTWYNDRISSYWNSLYWGLPLHVHVYIQYISLINITFFDLIYSLNSFQSIL